MATNTTKTSASNNGVASKKKTSKRRMKKQVRRTLGGLFLASAIAVAAIPVEPTIAKSTSDDYSDDTSISATTITYTKNIVRAVHYTDASNSTYEKVNGADASSNWYSGVPYIDENEQIYVDENDKYRFAFIRHNDGEQFAVILGINDSKIDPLTGSLTIPETVDAYYAYANNTSSGKYSYCAVNREGNFLYWADSAQESSITDGLHFKTTYYAQDLSLVNSLKTKEKLRLDDINKLVLTNGTQHLNEEFWSELVGSSYVERFDNTMNATAGYKDSGLNVGDPAYMVSYWDFEYDSSLGEKSEVDGVLEYAGKWMQKNAYFSVTPIKVLTYFPCYIDSVDDWSPNGTDKTLYYWKLSSEVDVTNKDGFAESKPTETTGRVQGCDIRYIGMQSIDPIFDSDSKFTGKWKVTEPTTKTEDGDVICYPSRGVFSNQGKLVNLTICDNLAGIGDFAFYQCTALESVTFSNRINTIGNGAFYGCTKLKSINPENDQPWVKSDISIIGASAFEGCVNLGSFSLPLHGMAIGDRAFRGCSGLSEINLFDSEGDSNLNIIGYNSFNNCSGLSEIVIPRGFTQKVPVHYFDGCTSLQKISLMPPKNLQKNDNDTDPNFDFDIIDGDPFVDSGYTGGVYNGTIEKNTFHHDAVGVENCDIDDWLGTLSENFYFEACNGADLHITAKEHSAAFLYDNTDNNGNYEIVMVCDEDPNHENTFVVDTHNNLVSSNIDPECHVITIPSTIGGYSVSTISPTGFSNNCSLRRVYIPGTVNKIEAGAFKGCHNLQTVFFTSTNYGLIIEDGAFATQLHEGEHALTCKNSEGNYGLDSTPKLNFVGAIDEAYAPFAYAMSKNNKINVGDQPKTYITYYSGWPTFQTVMYNPDRESTGDENELVAYPTKSYLSTIAEEWQSAGTSTAKANVLDKYPFLTEAQFDSMKKVYEYWKDPENKTLDSEDQEICAESIENIDVFPGIEHIKEGLFSNIDSDGNIVEKSLTPDSSISNIGANIAIKSITLHSVKTVEPYTFAGMKNLEKFDMVGGNEIGDYAFYGDTKLTDVDISGDVNKMGIRPFRDCTKLEDVTFNGTNFSCDDYIIYDLTNGRAIVECLETRSASNAGASVLADELSGVTAMYPEAFLNCDSISAVDLSNAKLKDIPERAFAGMDRLNRVTLPNSVTSIKKDAFLDTDNLDSVVLPNPGLNGIAADAFSLTIKGYRGSDTYDEFYSGYESEESNNVLDVNKETSKPEYNPYVPDKNTIRDYRTITFYTPTPGEDESSGPVSYAENPDYPYIVWKDQPVPCTVTFWDYTDPTDQSTSYSLKTFKIDSGSTVGSVYMPSDPIHDGSEFKGWKYTDSAKNVYIYTSNEVAELAVTGDMEFLATYKNDDCTVIFYASHAGEREKIDEYTVQYGTAATAPDSLPSYEGYSLIRDDNGMPKWTRDPDSSSSGLKNITNNPTTFTAYYEKVDTSDKHHVVFYNWDDSIVSEQYVADGEAASTPASPTRSGYTFTGWKPADFTNITKDTEIYAQFEKNSSSGGSGGGSGSGGSGSGGSSSGSTTGNSSGSSSSGNSSSAKTYTVTVINGSGSGTYAEGSTVVIAANDPASGKTFDKWTTADVTLASTTLPATTFKMPGKNVTVTANYKAGTTTNAVRYATGNSSRPPATGSTATGSTQVQVNKGGVSNVDLASATVKGSTDSFIVKVTETNEATNAVENALNNRFGGLDALRYWPCDISLYDSTGNTKITDTTGLQIDITLPIPDNLRQYGGNNKVAAVSNGQLEELSTRFNTVNGTPTVTFTATHFSPYVIYADTNNLNAAEMLDASPKTGDPIHPKWFLAIALAAGSVFMFLKKDKKPVAATV